MSIKMSNIEFQSVKIPTNDPELPDIEHRARVVIGCSCILEPKDVINFEKLKPVIESDLSNTLMNHVYGDLLPLVGKLSLIARSNPKADQREIQNLMMDIGCILAGKQLVLRS